MGMIVSGPFRRQPVNHRIWSDPSVSALLHEVQLLKSTMNEQDRQLRRLRARQYQPPKVGTTLLKAGLWGALLHGILTSILPVSNMIRRKGPDTGTFLKGLGKSVLLGAGVCAVTVAIIDKAWTLLKRHRQPYYT